MQHMVDVYDVRMFVCSGGAGPTGGGSLGHGGLGRRQSAHVKKHVIAE
jgi:hypothetical protein